MEIAQPLTITPKGDEKEISKIMEIEQDINNYKLNVKIVGNSLVFSLFDETSLSSYSKKTTLKELKDTYKALNILSSCTDFLEYLKKTKDKNYLTIEKTDSNISINIIVEYFLHQETIKIDLFQERMGVNSSKNISKYLPSMQKAIKNLEQNYKKIIEKQDRDYKELKEENNNLKQKLNLLEEKINTLIDNSKKVVNQNEIKEAMKEEKKEDKNNFVKMILSIDSAIMQNNELDLINTEIENKMKKEIKEYKKLYQATRDGGDVSIFHSKCDNIPNTLTLIKSEGNRRFGGFISVEWESQLKATSKDDKNAFLFSLDKMKIYPYKGDGIAINCQANKGPCFGYGYTIKTEQNILKKKKLKTYESNPECSYDFKGDKNALSEDGNYKGILAQDYEVFEVMFY